MLQGSTSYVNVQVAQTLSYFQAHPLFEYINLYNGRASSTIFSQTETDDGDEEVHLSKIAFLAEYRR